MYMEYCWMELSDHFKAYLRTNFKQWDPRSSQGYCWRCECCGM